MVIGDIGLLATDWGSTSVAIAVVVMAGIIVTAIVWQLLAIARDRSGRNADGDARR